MIGSPILIAMWPFANGWMLLWGLAAVLPLLIHLWSRRKYDEIAWAAMEYLLAAVRKNARRLRIEQLLLLAVRTAILILLAVALADPVMSLFPTLGGVSTTIGNTHTILVVDASYSMDYRQTDSSRFDLAKRLAGGVIHQGNQGDGFTLICMTDRPFAAIAAPAYDTQDVITELESLRRMDGGAHLLATLAVIQQTLDQAITGQPRLTRHRVCFFTDLGKTTWGDVTKEEVRSAIARISTTAKLELFDVATGPGQNVAVTRVSSSEGFVTIMRPTRLQIELENFGSQNLEGQEVAILVDGQRISEQRVDVPAGGRSSITTRHVFQVPGEHGVEARLSQDPLPVDNHRWLSLNVRDAIKVLCVEGKAGAARNLAIALEPGQSAQPRIRVVTRSENAILEEDLDPYDCIFLCNIGRFAQDEATLLDQYVQRGGGLVIFLGDQVQSDNYTHLLEGSLAGHSLMPVRLGEPAMAGSYQVDPLDYHHPIVEMFRGNERAGLLTTPVWKYIRVPPDPSGQTETVLAFRNGDPMILANRVGEGRVILVTTAGSAMSFDHTTVPATPWTAWPAWPSFPPMVQQMLEFAVKGDVKTRAIHVGESMTGTFPLAETDATLTVEDPASGRHRVSIATDSNRSNWVFAATQMSGLYRVRLAGDDRIFQQCAVNLDTRESRMDRQDPTTLPSQFQHKQSSMNTAEVQRETPGPVHYFRHILAAVLGLLLTETYLAWFFGRTAV